MKIFYVTAVCLALAACAGSSPRIDASQLGALEKGQVTVDEVVRKFGRPSVLLRNPDGTQTARYLHSNESDGTTRMVPLLATAPVDSVTFYFNTNGRLTDYKITQAHTRDETAVSSVPSHSPSAAPVQAPASGAPAPRAKPKSNDNRLTFPLGLPPATNENR